MAQQVYLNACAHQILLATVLPHFYARILEFGYETRLRHCGQNRDQEQVW